MWRKVQKRLSGKERWRGQSLVEFALILPILLLLFFGIIEFAALFYAWLTLEHAAREAARYAATGSYNTIYCSEVAGYLQAAAPPPGGYSWAAWDMADGESDCEVPLRAGPGTEGIDYHNSDSEWYYQTVTARLQDAARLFSIRDAAYESAIALMVDESASGDITRNNDFQGIGGWSNGDPEARGYFHATICSTRPNFYLDEDNLYGLGEFVCIYDDTPGDYTGFNIDDPGGPNDRVTLVLTLNHPLITPIQVIAPGPGHYITLRSIREMVVEIFRAARVLVLPPLQSWVEPPTPTPTPTSTPTPTPTPACDLELEWAGYRDNDQANFWVQNVDFFEYQLVGLNFSWPTMSGSPYLDYVGMRRWDPSEDVHINDTVFHNSPANITSFNGGTGGIRTLPPVSDRRRIDFDFNNISGDIYPYNPSEFVLMATFQTSDGFVCEVTAQGPDEPPTCDDLIVDPEQQLHFGNEPYGYNPDYLVTARIENISGYPARLDRFTLGWPLSELYSDRTFYMDETRMHGDYDMDQIHGGNGTVDPYTENGGWSGGESNRYIWPGEAEWMLFDHDHLRIFNIREAWGIDLAPRHYEILDSSVSGYYPSSNSYYAPDNIVHPDQYSVETEWTFAGVSNSPTCLLDLSYPQKGPFVRVLSPPAVGELPGGLGRYEMRPSHLEGAVGVSPVILGGEDDVVSGTLTIQIEAFDRDYGNSAESGTGIREVALWVEGPENLPENHEDGDDGPDYNLLRGRRTRDWYYLTATPYEVTFNLADLEWPDGSGVYSGTHYLYVRVMDRDDTRDLSRLFTLLVVPFEVVLPPVSCGDVEHGDEMFLPAYFNNDADERIFTDLITNTTDFPLVLDEVYFYWPAGDHGDLDGFYRGPRVENIRRYDPLFANDQYSHYGDGYSDPWHVTSGWREEEYRSIDAGDTNNFAFNINRLDHFDVGRVLDLPYNPWYPSDPARMAPQANYVSYSDHNWFYDDRGRNDDSIGGNIMHAASFDPEVELYLDFPGGMGTCLFTFPERKAGPAIQLAEPGPVEEELSSAYAAAPAYPDHYYVRPWNAMAYSSAPSPHPSNCLDAGEPITLQGDAWDIDDGGIGTPNGTGVQEIAVYIVGPNSEYGYRNLLRSDTRDWYYLTADEISDFGSGTGFVLVNNLSPSSTWPGSGRGVVNGTHYLFIRVMDDDDSETKHGEPYQPLYTLLVTTFEICGGQDTPPTPTPPPTAVVTSTPTEGPTSTPTNTPTLVPTPTDGPTATPSNTPTPSRTPTASPTSPATDTPTPSPTATRTPQGGGDG